MLPTMLAGDSAELRKARRAFFTPYPIAQFLFQWALRGDRQSVLDPTCGEGVFLLAAADDAAGNRPLDLFGVDIHGESLEETRRLLLQAGHEGANMLTGDFFDEPSPDQIGARIPFVGVRV